MSWRIGFDEESTIADNIIVDDVNDDDDDEADDDDDDTTESAEEDITEMAAREEEASFEVAGATTEAAWINAAMQSFNMTIEVDSSCSRKQESVARLVFKAFLTLDKNCMTALRTRVQWK